MTETSAEPHRSQGAGKCPVSHIAAEFNPFADDYLQDPYAVFTRARAEEPVFFSPSLGYWVVSRHEDVRQVFQDPAFSASISITPLKELCPAAVDELVKAEMVMGPSLVNEDPPLHTKRRRLIQKAMISPARIEAVTPRIRALTTSYIDGFVRRGHADLVADFAWEIPALVAFALMGVPDEDVERAKEFAGRLALFTWGYPSEEEQRKLAAGMGQYWIYAKEHVKRRLEDPTDDYISNLIAAWRKPGNEDLFDENYLVTTMMNFLFAGHETTTNATANGLRALLEHRDQWAALCADPSLVPGAVEEILRFSSSVVAWRREATEDTHIGDVPIPAQAKVLVLTGSANHDEEVFPEPERFDITRTNADEHLAFGFGRHLCLGAPLARIEMGIFLEELTRRLPHMQLAEGQTFTYSPNTSFRGPDHLFVGWDPSQNPVPEDRP
ncbi:cytochrome P450 CYP116 (plasmid) [Rhodococcus jostii RHA1]|uniref:Cytochrome P450 CYP116 n=1 Tax=Rhodococcus jostii (strain RHA1) TaxID=101510 RepID=Q0RUR9_RHOJR|nr:cytochrome P450 [Rhodococcus jostii]ABH00967.1 cytochrome P450 CYP116 [Rhodococcus jostii RHA1]